ncbi:hypothetical protein ACYF6T_33170 [Streptomyces sp. 7R007]
MVVRDGKLVLLQSKHAGDIAAPPTSQDTPAPGFPPWPSGLGNRAQYAASA